MKWHILIVRLHPDYWPEVVIGPFETQKHALMHLDGPQVQGHVQDDAEDTLVLNSDQVIEQFRSWNEGVVDVEFEPVMVVAP